MFVINSIDLPKMILQLCALAIASGLLNEKFIRKLASLFLTHFFVEVVNLF